MEASDRRMPRRGWRQGNRPAHSRASAAASGRAASVAGTSSRLIRSGEGGSVPLAHDSHNFGHVAQSGQSCSDGRATGAGSPHPEDHYIPAIHRLGMPYAIISDIHANLEALDVVLADIAARQPDAVVCLGDLVGYGPDPAACVERVRTQLRPAVPGNPNATATAARGTGPATCKPFRDR